jgi:hypothetical protein
LSVVDALQFAVGANLDVVEPEWRRADTPCSRVTLRRKPVSRHPDKMVDGIFQGALKGRGKGWVCVRRHSLGHESHSLDG